MKKLFKKSIGVLISAIIAMQGITAFAAEETVYTYGDFDFCQPGDIYVNETFDWESVTDHETENGLAKWQIRGSELQDGGLNIPNQDDSGKKYAKLTLNSKVTEGEKYVFSFDINRPQCSGRITMNINGKRSLYSDASNDNATWTIAEGGSFATIASGIPVGETVNVCSAI